MERLSDGKEVSSRTYYYLLGWNEENEWEFMMKNFNKSKLSNLTLEEFTELFSYATQKDYDNF